TYTRLCLLSSDIFLFCFFFQAEDGIRDRNVTGVQTCALPICAPAESRRSWRALLPPSNVLPSVAMSAIAPLGTFLETVPLNPRRSEERRVGKECRSRRWADE